MVLTSQYDNLRRPTVNTEMESDWYVERYVGPDGPIYDSAELESLFRPFRDNVRNFRSCEVSPVMVDFTKKCNSVTVRTWSKRVEEAEGPGDDSEEGDTVLPPTSNVKPFVKGKIRSSASTRWLLSMLSAQRLSKRRCGFNEFAQETIRSTSVVNIRASSNVYFRGDSDIRILKDPNSSLERLCLQSRQRKA